MSRTEQIAELTTEVITLILTAGGRSRSRTANEQLSFEHAVRVLTY